MKPIRDFFKILVNFLSCAAVVVHDNFSVNVCRGQVYLSQNQFYIFIKNI